MRREPSASGDVRFRRSTVLHTFDIPGDLLPSNDVRRTAWRPLMQDTTLFETILGITTPWCVARVELKPDDKRVDLWLEHEPTRWPCPECGETLAGFDHAEERTWRHLDTCQFQTHLHAEIPWLQCPRHGVKQVRAPWAEPRSRFTLLMEWLQIDLIQQCSTVKGACQIAGVSWDEAWGGETGSAVSQQQLDEFDRYLEQARFLRLRLDAEAFKRMQR